MRYVSARIEETVREKTYRIYVTDCLKTMVPGGKGLVRYVDFFTKPDNSDPEEIKTSIKNKLAEIGGDNTHEHVQSGSKAEPR